MLCIGYICPKRPNYLLLYFNLDDMICSENLITFILTKTKPGVKLMLVKFTSYPSDRHICVIITQIMYPACIRCKHGDNKTLFISSLSQFLKEQVAKPGTMDVMYRCGIKC